jgi:predicted phosphodiesterase
VHLAKTHHRERQGRGAGRILSVAAIAVGLLALVDAPETWAAEPQQQPFRFVQLCDTQLGFGAAGYESDVESFRQAVRQINQIKPDFAVICGDLVNTPTADAFADFKDVLSEFKVPCYCAAGNHDVGSPPDQKTLDQYRQTIGKDYYSFEHKGYTFLVANTQLWKTPVEPEASKHDTWFVQTLELAVRKSSPAFVIGHHPLFISDADEKEAYFNIPPQRRKELLDLFLQHGVVAMLTGHTHRLCDNEHEGVLLLSGETTSKNFDKRPLGFRLWEVGSPDSIRHSFVPLESQDNAVEQDP